MMKVREWHWFAALLLIVFMAACSGTGGGGNGTTSLSDAKAITAFSFASPAATGTIVENAKTIAVTVPNGTDVTALAATFSTTGASVKVGGTVQVSGATTNTFTSPVAYTVTAADSTTATYIVTITVAPSSAKAITAFSLLGVSGVVNESARTITVALPSGTNVTALAATFTTTGVSVKVGGTVQVSGTTTYDFTSPVTYTVTATDSATATYTVTVTVAASSSKAITAFSFATPAATGIINESSKTISVTVPSGTSVTALAAIFTTTGASVKVSSTAQISGTTTNNFTNPMTYTVTAADSTTATYTVTVTVSASAGTSAIKLPKTGQATCYDTVGAVISCATATAAGQNGALQKGVAWPDPRFTTNTDTTVTDNLTGFVWAPNGNLMPTRDNGWDADYTAANFWEAANDGMVTWQHALDYVTKLNAENYLGHSDWRLPNKKELRSLVNYGQANTATWLNTQGFTNAQADDYWSSTSYTSHTYSAWYVIMSDGSMSIFNKTDNLYVWPVRAGQ